MFNYCCTEAIYSADMNVAVGQKVTLPCIGVPNNSPVRWLYRQDKLSNPKLIASGRNETLAAIQPSGRFAVHMKRLNNFSLVIYEAQISDSGFYGCASNNSYHITRLSVQRKCFLIFDRTRNHLHLHIHSSRWLWKHSDR